MNANAYETIRCAVQPAMRHLADNALELLASIYREPTTPGEDAMRDSIKAEQLRRSGEIAERRCRG
jgi:hypothetical protein